MFKLCFRPDAIPHDNDLCLIFNKDNEVLANTTASDLRVLRIELGQFGLLDFTPTDGFRHAVFLGSYMEPPHLPMEKSVWLLRLPNEYIDSIAEKTSLSFLPVRQVTRMVQSEDLVFRLYRGLQIHRWMDRYKFCPGCGQVLSASMHELALECHACKTSNYPTISPAMIVAITRKNGSELLLVQARNRTGDWWSLVAGYSEAGESIEQTVVREIMEETSLRVKNLVYVESQSWPFGQSMMIGFTAEYESGELNPDPSEIENAAWFPLTDLPPIPKPPSIGNRLITLVSERHHKENKAVDQS